MSRQGRQGGPDGYGMGCSGGTCGNVERRQPRAVNGLWEGESEGKALSARKGC
ncbi:hypothetical protein SAMN02745704_02928, partial [Paucidesulfovibrio gracilis DSM 16080]